MEVILGRVEITMEQRGAGVFEATVGIHIAKEFAGTVVEKLFRKLGDVIGEEMSNWGPIAHTGFLEGKEANDFMQRKLGRKLAKHKTREEWNDNLP